MQTSELHDCINNPWTLIMAYVIYFVSWLMSLEDVLNYWIPIASGICAITLSVFAILEKMQATKLNRLQIKIKEKELDNLENAKTTKDD